MNAWTAIPTFLRGAEIEREHARREAEKAKGRIYNKIRFRGKAEEYGGWDYTVSELPVVNPALNAILKVNTTGRWTLTVSTCALMPDLVEEAHYERPLWVMHMPDLPDSHIFGESTNFGVAENPIGADLYADPRDGTPRLYLDWRLWKWDRILVPVNEVFKSLKDADDGEGRIVIAFVGAKNCAVRQTLVPVGLLPWLEYWQADLLNGAVVDRSIPVSEYYPIMTVQHISPDPRRVEVGGPELPDMALG